MSERILPYRQRRHHFVPDAVEMPVPPSGKNRTKRRKSAVRHPVKTDRGAINGFQPKTAYLTESQSQREAVREKAGIMTSVKQGLWIFIGLFEFLLEIRFVLKILGISGRMPVAGIIYDRSAPLVGPFLWHFRSSGIGNSTVEWGTLVAMVVYFIVFSVFIPGQYW